MWRNVFAWTALGVVLGTPVAPALACGGTFCSAGGAGSPTPVAPVDQNGERIVFVVDSAAGVVCSHVQINYRGAPESFGWVVPVPAVPTIGESDDALFAALDAATQLSVVPPAQNTDSCGGGLESEDDTSGCGCTGDDTKNLSADADPSEFANDSANPPVTVYARTTTANYEAVVVGGDRADDLIDWLRENGFNFSDNMRPAVSAYVDDHMKFAAFKLLEGKSAQDIAPVVLCYEAAAPAIPLRLTAVAAQPSMGISVTIMGDVTFGLLGGEAVLPDPEQIVFDFALFATNYFEWVARLADESEGAKWVLEYTGGHALRMALPGMEHTAQDFPWLTRYYTRLSPEHMDVDPVFMASVGRNTQPAVIDLSTQPEIDLCAIRTTSPCFDNYCGRGAECTARDTRASVRCLCPAGAVAQPVVGPDALARVTCTPAVSPLGITDEAAGVGSSFDPCNAYDCGEGHCVLKNGFPACVCSPGAGAGLDAALGVRCYTVAPDAPRYGPGAGPESVIEAQPAALSTPGGRDEGGLPRVPVAFAWVALLFGGRIFVRRRARAAVVGGR